MFRRKNLHSKRHSSGSHAVVLVHGILGQGFVYWNLVKRYLSGDDYHFHEVRLPFFGFGDLANAAHRLKIHIDAILAECAATTGEKQVDLIAHSAGGLAARYYIKHLGGDQRVHSLVTLGTPHQGTFSSKLLPFNPVARQTLPNSDFLQALNKGRDTKLDVHYTSVYSRMDGVVMPWQNARLPGARNVEIRFVTHWGFLWDRQVYKLIRDAIDHSPGKYPYYRVRPQRKASKAKAKPPAKPKAKKTTRPRKRAKGGRKR